MNNQNQICGASDSELLTILRNTFKLPTSVHGTSKIWTTDLEYNALDVSGGPQSVGPMSQGTIGLFSTYPKPPIEFKLYGGYWNNVADHVLRWFSHSFEFHRLKLNDQLRSTYTLYAKGDEAAAVSLFSQDAVIAALLDLQGLDMELERSSGRLITFEPVRSYCVNHCTVQQLIDLHSLVLPAIEKLESRQA